MCSEGGLDAKKTKGNGSVTTTNPTIPMAAWKPFPQNSQLNTAQSSSKPESQFYICPSGMMACGGGLYKLMGNN